MGVLTGGKTHKINLSIKNNIPYRVTASFKISGDPDVTLLVDSINFIGGAWRELPLEITPSITRLTPIRFRLEVRYEFVVE